MSNYRISFLRSAGWTRLGLAGAVAALFGGPMLWALGAFGGGDEALHRAVIFVIAGLWFFVAVFYVIGWALQGFVVRIKAPEDEAEDGPPRRPGPATPPPPSARPPVRSGH